MSIESEKLRVASLSLKSPARAIHFVAPLSVTSAPLLRVGMDEDDVCERWRRFANGAAAKLACPTATAEEGASYRTEHMSTARTEPRHVYFCMQSLRRSTEESE